MMRSFLSRWETPVSCFSCEDSNAMPALWQGESSPPSRANPRIYKRTKRFHANEAGLTTRLFLEMNACIGIEIDAQVDRIRSEAASDHFCFATILYLIFS